MKRWLAIIFIPLLLLPVLLFTWLISSESGLRWSMNQAQPFIPGDLNFTELSGRLIGPINITGITYQLDGQRIETDQLELDWRPTELLAGHIDISRLYLSGLKIHLPPPTPDANNKQALTLPEIKLPWRLGLNDVRIDNIQIIQQQQTFQLTQLSLKANTVISRIDIERLSLSAENFSLDINGELRPTRQYRHKLNVAWTFKPPQSEWLSGKGQLVGDVKQLKLKQQVSGPLELNLEAELKNLLEQLTWQAKADISNIDTHRFDPTLPAITGKLNLQGQGNLETADISGRADGHHAELGPFDSQFKLRRLTDNTLMIDQLALHTPVTETQLNARGQWQPGAGGGTMDLALHWQKLRWPLQGTPWFDSTLGSAWLTGSLAQYQFGIATDRPWPEAPPSDWYGSATGNLDGMDIHSLRITLLEGETLATGRLDWSDQFHWQADVTANEINPVTLLPDWPGKLNASIISSGGIQNGQLLAKADIQQLHGTLRGYPVSLRSQVTWRNQGLDIASFNFNSGTSNIQASGRLADELSLDWTLNSPNLAELYAEAGGQLSANGSVNGPRDTPKIAVSVSGNDFSLPDYRIGSLNGSMAVDLFRWQQLDLALKADTINFKDQTLQSIQLDGSGSDGQHQLRAEINSDAINSIIAITGQANASGWQGRLEQADISTRDYKSWQLKSPARLEISAEKIEAEPLCWMSSDGNICLTLQRDTDKLQAKLEAMQLPLMLFTPWLPPDLKLEGTSNAHADFTLQLPNKLRGNARIQLPAGILSYPVLEGERDRWQYNEGLIEITLDDKGIHANSNLSMGNGDRFKGTLKLPGAELLSLDSNTQKLQADAELAIHKLELIEALVPEVQDLQGEVNITLRADGVLKQPQLRGLAQLRNGALRIPRLGLNINQLKFEAKSDAFETLNFQLTAHSGEGTLNIEGKTRLDKQAGWPTEINIKGNSFEVSRIPEARVLVSPDLRVQIQKRTVRIEGNVHIPFAKLQPKDITTATKISDDAVIIGGDQAALEKWAVFTKVRLTLGDRIHFFGFGFEGRFGGNLLLEDEPGELTRGTGELTVPEGRYRAYGQRLEVEQGRLLYTGGPLSNPGIDLRAVRHVGSVTAGLKVRGTLRQPQIELFSIPAMGETDALAYLILGRPIETSSDEEGAMLAKAALALGLSGGDRLARSLGERFGLDEMRIESSDSGEQASLVMGRYLSPKLYISYGVGLIEAFNTINLRYQISDKWQLKAESGEYHGADLLYTIEH